MLAGSICLGKHGLLALEFPVARKMHLLTQGDTLEPN